MNLKELLASKTIKTKLYKQPPRIGDVVNIQDKKWIIIGIQDVSTDGFYVIAKYIVQNVEIFHNYQPKSSPSENLVEVQSRMRTGEIGFRDHLQLGHLFWIDGMPFQSVEFTDIEIEQTDLKVSFLARPIRPIRPLPIKEVKKTGFKEVKSIW